MPIGTANITISSLNAEYGKGNNLAAYLGASVHPVGSIPATGAISMSLFAATSANFISTNIVPSVNVAGGVDIGPTGIVYVVQTGSPAASGAGKLYTYTSTSGLINVTVSPSLVGYPSIAINQSTGLVYVLETGASSSPLYSVASDGTRSSILATLPTACWRLAINNSGTLYTATSSGSKLLYQINGSTVAQLGSAFSNNLFAVAVDKNSGTVYVSDTIQIWSVNPTTGTATSFSGRANIFGLAVDASGNVYAIEGGTNVSDAKLWCITPAGVGTIIVSGGIHTASNQNVDVSVDQISGKIYVTGNLGLWLIS